MVVRKAVIPAAGLGTRFLPATKAVPKEMMPIIDIPTIQLIVEEAAASGIEDIVVVTGRGKRAIEDHFDTAYELEALLKEKGKRELLRKTEHTTQIANLHYVRQHEPKGLGHAIWCARHFVGDEPFAVLLGDTFFDAPIPAMKQVMDCYDECTASVLGVQSVKRENVSAYGVIAGSPVMGGREGLLRISALVEKPSVEDAPSDLAILGRYVFTPAIFDVLGRQEPGVGGEIQLTDALARLMEKEALFAAPIQGQWYDVGEPVGYVKAILAMAAKRDEFTGMV